MKPLRTLLSIAGLLLLCSGVALGGEAKELTSKELFAKVSPAVIKIHTYNAEGKAVSQGSGFFVSADGLLVTNYHVIAKAVSAKVLLSDGKTLNVSGMAASLPGRDLALLKVETPKRSFLKVARKAPEVGSKVFAIGSPKGLTNTISEGLVSGYREFKSGVKLLQTSAPISPGSSGGPLLVNTGEVVGVTTASWRTGEDLNFAIPNNYIRALTLIAERPKPLPGVTTGEEPATTTSKPPKPMPPAKSFSSITEALSKLPGRYFPKGSGKFTGLQENLINDWLKKNVPPGSLMAHTGRLSRVPSGGSSGVTLNFEYKNIVIHGKSVELRALARFDGRFADELLKVKKGSQVTLHGKIKKLTLWNNSYYGICWLLHLERSKFGSIPPLPKPTPAPSSPTPKRTPEQICQGWYSLGKTFLEAGKKEQARKYFQRIIDKHPKSDYAAKARKELEKLKK